MSIRTKLAVIDLCIGSGPDGLEPAQPLCASAPAIVMGALSFCDDGLTTEGIARATELNTESVRYAVGLLSREGIIVQADPGVFVLSDTELLRNPDFTDELRRCIARNRYVTRIAVAEELDASEGEIARAVYSLRCSGVDIRQFDAEEDVVYWEAMP